MAETDFEEYKTKYFRFCLTMAQPVILPYMEQFAPLRDDLRRANIRMAFEEYVCVAAMTTVLVGLLSFPVVALLVLLIFKLHIFLVFLVAVVLSIASATFSVGYFYFYPPLRGDAMKKSIENNLPFAAIYLSTLAGTGMPLESILRLFSKFPEYGEISSQARSIMMDVDSSGLDIHTALIRASDRSPSEELKALWNGIRSTISTGGDLKIYLIEKSKTYMAMYRRNIDAYVEQLSLFTELYITAVIVGSILFIVMTAIMNMLGSGTEMMGVIQGVVIYILLPLVSVGFLIMTAAMSPI